MHPTSALFIDKEVRIGLNLKSNHFLHLLKTLPKSVIDDVIVRERSEAIAVNVI